MIRLQRIGRKNHAEFRVVLTESQNGPKSSYQEKLGSYNPHTNSVTLEGERIKYWMSKGAQVSDTVHNLLVSNKVVEGKKINVLPKKTAPVKEVSAEAPKAAPQASEEPKAEAEAEKEAEPAA